jgi:predicted TIM-barrel fold metal-dependent hydrolase
MPGVRLHPNYHGYKLDEPVLERLLKLASERGLIVQIAVRMEDPRTQHRLLAVGDVELTPLVKLLPKHPRLRVQLLNAMSGLRADLLDRPIAAGEVCVEIAMLEGVAGIEKLLSHVPLARVLFGSYFPFFAWEAAELKLRESVLGEAQREAIRVGNAERILQLAGPSPQVRAN